MLSVICAQPKSTQELHKHLGQQQSEIPRQLQIKY